MKQQITRYVLAFGVACSLSSSFEQSAQAEGGMCSLGPIGLEATPTSLNIKTPDGECKTGRTIIGRLVLRTTGEPINMHGVDLAPRTNEDNVFISRDTVKYMSVQLETSDSWEFSFTPKKPGEYNAVITFTYGYSFHKLFGLLDCIKRQYTDRLNAKKKAVKEMEIVGPDYRMIDQRLLLENKNHRDRITAVENEIAGYHSDIRRLQEEKEKALEEMRDGEFCSTCGKTRSEFRKRGANFDQHIREGASEGRHVRSATPEELEEKEREYNEMIKPIYGRITASREKIPGINTQHELAVTRIESQRAILKQSFDDRVENLKSQITTLQQAYDTALADADDLRKARKTITAHLKGTCHE